MLPAAFRPLAEEAYFFQRGTLLGHLLSSPQERALLQAEFLSASLPVASRMSVPSLHVLGRPGPAAAAAPPGEGFVEVPPVDLALLLGVAAVLDCGSQVFVWVGRGEGRAGVEARCARFAAAQAEGRAPFPEVVVLAEGEDDPSPLLLRLAPMRRDARAAQRAQLPLLDVLPAGAVDAACDALPATEEPSLLEWLRRHDVALQLPQKQR